MWTGTTATPCAHKCDEIRKFDFNKKNFNWKLITVFILKLYNDSIFSLHVVMLQLTTPKLSWF